MSRRVPYSEGIPQGRVLSCTCFMVVVNEIDSCLLPNINSALYVDDYVIYASGSVSHIIERRLQNAISNFRCGVIKLALHFQIQKQ